MPKNTGGVLAKFGFLSTQQGLLESAGVEEQRGKMADLLGEEGGEIEPF
jgi:hypothetical protein